MGSALSGRDFGQAGKARPLHACLRKVDGGTTKIELERLRKPKLTADVKILPRNNEAPETQVDSGTLLPANRRLQALWYHGL